MARLLLAGGSALAAAGGWFYLAPEYHSPTCQHSAITDQDSEALRSVWDGRAVAAAHNPGVRVRPDFLSVREAEELLRELQPIKAQYGVNLIQPAHAAIYRFQQSYLPRASQALVNMLRVTGRPEANTQTIPPWGYAEGFQEAALPPRLRALVQRVRALPGIQLGPLRDVTINYRHSGYLRLDPHVDPALDGENVFIIGLDSDTVLTLCPARLRTVWRAVHEVMAAVTLADERQGVRRDAERSWTPLDIDVLARARALVHLSGAARWSWTHGTRLGVPCEGGLCDWWGDPQTLIKRGPQRHSVVLAFAAAPDQAHT